ncbi:unnamed protein product [Lactuca virosa]|uniref:Uncharacterized protein n=1 Tax=Lactuca virosa TaxID=75947 RepID=A0AAU9PM44_9ASTR|nr:unnamed protein product [Lactuca virosa]
MYLFLSLYSLHFHRSISSSKPQPVLCTGFFPEDQVRKASGDKWKSLSAACKRRNEFLKIRERVVKIQAHFCGHKVRKHYKKVVCSVAIVEKAILRWRPKSRGLRGFWPELRAPESEYDFLRIGRKQKYVGVEEALARLHSMARNPEGQEHYAQEFQKTSSKTLPWLGVSKMDT